MLKQLKPSDFFNLYYDLTTDLPFLCQLNGYISKYNKTFFSEDLDPIYPIVKWGGNWYQ